MGLIRNANFRETMDAISCGELQCEGLQKGEVSVLTLQKAPVWNQIHLDEKIYKADVKKSRDWLKTQCDVRDGIAPIYVTVAPAFGNGLNPFNVVDILAGDIVHLMIEETGLDYKKDFCQPLEKPDVNEVLFLLHMTLYANQLRPSRQLNTDVSTYVTDSLSYEQVRSWSVLKFHMYEDDWRYPEVQYYTKDKSSRHDFVRGSMWVANSAITE